jgi:hypothetical protein
MGYSVIFSCNIGLTVKMAKRGWRKEERRGCVLNLMVAGIVLVPPGQL